MFVQFVAPGAHQGCQIFHSVCVCVCVCVCLCVCLLVHGTLLEMLSLRAHFSLLIHEDHDRHEKLSKLTMMGFVEPARSVSWCQQ